MSSFICHALSLLHQSVPSASNSHPSLCFGHAISLTSLPAQGLGREMGWLPRFGIQRSGVEGRLEWVGLASQCEAWPLP